AVRAPHPPHPDRRGHGRGARAGRLWHRPARLGGGHQHRPDFLGHGGCAGQQPEPGPPGGQGQGAAAVPGGADVPGGAELAAPVQGSGADGAPLRDQRDAPPGAGGAGLGHRAGQAERGHADRPGGGQRRAAGPDRRAGPVPRDPERGAGPAGRRAAAHRPGRLADPGQPVQHVAVPGREEPGHPGQPAVRRAGLPADLGRARAGPAGRGTRVAVAVTDRDRRPADHAALLVTRPVRPGGAVSGQVVLLVTSPAVRPGLLGWPAWQTLGGAAQVLAASAEHPLLPYLDEAGIGWAVLPGAAGAGPGELARLLTAAAAAQPGPVVWLPAAEPPGSVDHDVVPALARELGGAAEVVTGSAGLPGAELLVLVEVMDTLRRRCPWDARQTHESLAPFLLEESYEALDALESGDRAALREELGDVLLQVMFHARVAAERADGTGFTIDDVADGIVSKLVRRHPHVFADVAVSGAEDVKRNWD